MFSSFAYVRSYFSSVFLMGTISRDFLKVFLSIPSFHYDFGEAGFLLSGNALQQGSRAKDVSEMR